VEQKSEVIEAGKTFVLGWKVRLLVLGVLLAALGAFVYPVALRDLALSVLHREGSSHGLFVPFISGWFLWRERDRLRQAELQFSPLPGIPAIGAGFVLLFLARGSAELALSALSFLTVASGLVLLILGSAVFRALSFPILFLATTIPLPDTIYETVGEWMRAATTTGSVWLTQAMHLPVYREGYTIQLTSTNLFIDTSCSGIRYLLSYFVFSLPYAFLCKKGNTARVLTVLASFPLAVVAGVLRLSSIYHAVYFISPFMAQHRPHVVLSWFVFVGVLASAMTLDQYLSRMWAKKQRA
jgi:exosortase